MAAQNSGKTKGVRKRKMPKGKPFTKDDPRINKGGRPKGIARIVREMTGEEGEELVRLAWRFARGKIRVETPTATGVMKLPPPVKVRLDAIEYLTKRGHGKEPTTIEITGKDGGPLAVAHVDLRKLTDEQLEQFERLVSAATADPGGDSSGEGQAA